IRAPDLEIGYDERAVGRRAAVAPLDLDRRALGNRRERDARVSAIREQPRIRDDPDQRQAREDRERERDHETAWRCRGRLRAATLDRMTRARGQAACRTGGEPAARVDLLDEEAELLELQLRGLEVEHARRFGRDTRQHVEE